jgi:hypothetical protein
MVELQDNSRFPFLLPVLVFLFCFLFLFSLVLFLVSFSFLPLSLFSYNSFFKFDYFSASSHLIKNSVKE